jgi:hypothetical protein
MIRIDIKKIDNWNEIKQNQCQYFKNAIQNELSNLYISNNIYTKKRKKNNTSSVIVYYELNNLERKEIENIFGGLFSNKKQESQFRITNDKKVEEIITGSLEEVISIFCNHKINEAVIKRIFDYKKFCNNKKWGRHQLLFLLGINVCPYCNRQYITSYECKESNDRKATADLDHFYPQSKYPYLALSLYNFIPSCQICNSRFKLDENFRDIPHIYPYNEEFGENAKFKISGKSIDYLLAKSIDFDVFIDVKSSDFSEKIDKSIKTFHLNDVYKIHTDYIQEIIKKVIWYNSSRVSELYLDFPELFSSKEEILRIIFNDYICKNDFGKRPLSKLTKDICEDLGLDFEGL